MVDIEETNVGAHAMLVTNEGKIILQQRDNKPGIVNPGLISIWGGSLRLDESEEIGLKRELMEELEINIENYRVSKLGVFKKTAEEDGQNYLANVFIIENVKIEDLKIHEGKGVVGDYPAELLKSDKLTRITRLVLQSYIDSQNRF